MGDVLDDLVLNFDLNLLQEPSNDTAAPAQSKQLKNGKRTATDKILLLKKKIINTSTLIEKFNDKVAHLAYTESLLTASKEECRKVCIDYKNALEKIAYVEKEFETLKSDFLSEKSKFLEEKNNLLAAESFTKQLQVLVKDKDDLIESVKEECKELKAHLRESEKANVLLNKEKDVLFKNIQHLANLLFYKETTLSKTDKALVSKYKINNENRIDSLYEEVSSGSEFDDIDEQPVPVGTDEVENVTETNTKKVVILSDLLIAKNEKFEHNTKKDYNDLDSVCSLDTGRGSSSEFYDSDKCFNSPDYFIADSPLSIDFNNKKQLNAAIGDKKPAKIFVDKAVNTIKDDTSNKDTSNKATSTDPLCEGQTSDKKPVAKVFVDKAINTVNIPVAIKATSTSPIHEGSIFDEIPTAKIVQINDTPPKLPIASRLTPRRGINKGSIFDESPITKTAVDNDPTKLPIASKNATKSKKRISLSDEILKSETAVDKDVGATKSPLQKSVKHAANKKESICNDTTVPKSTVKKGISPLKIPVAGWKLPKRGTNQGSIFDEVEINLSPASEKEGRRYKDLVSLLNEDAKTKEIDKAVIKSSPGDRHAVRRAIDMDCLLDEFPAPKTTVDRAVSPIVIKSGRKDTATSPIKDADSGYLSGNYTIPIKECLESNYRNNLRNSDDSEIEMILNTMRLTHEVVTPIPPTPTIPIRTRSKVAKVDNKHTSNEGFEVYRDSQDHSNMAYLEKKVRFAKKIPRNIFDCKENKTNMEECNTCNVNEENTRASYINVVNADSELITIIEVIDDPTPSEESVIEEKAKFKELLQFEKEVHDVGDESISRNTTVTKKAIPKKLTRLQKLRKTLVPQSRIKKHVLPSRKLRDRIKRLQINKEKAKASELNVKLSNEEAFQRAVKIVAELKLKENAIKVKTIDRKKRHSMPSSLVPKSNNENEVNETPDTNCILTRSCMKRLSLSYDKDVVEVLSRTTMNETMTEIKLRDKVQVIDDAETSHILGKNSSKRSSIDKPIEPSTRILRSNTRRMSEEGKSDSERCESDTVIQKHVPKVQSDSQKSEADAIDKNAQKNESLIVSKTTVQSSPENMNSSTTLVDYNDLSLFDNEPCPKKRKIQEDNNNTVQENNNTAGIIINPQDSVLCKMIEKYGIKTIRNMPKKTSESVIKTICKKLEDGIEHIIKLPMSDTKNAMNKLADDMQRWKWKEFVTGLIFYLMEPARKLELFNKVNVLNAPAMTNSEQVLLYIVIRLRDSWQIDLFDCIFSQIEYTLFKLNHSPEFDAIESMSHFYAILCKYVKAKNRLRIFVLDAMYCLQFKAVPLIKQCIEVWFHILPLAHMGIAKSPLVTCVVYLLHYYKCEDKFNRVQDIRKLLHHKYYFNITDWNETKILEMFKNAIYELRDNSVERKMMRLALIILAKRQGPQWCQNKLIRNIILPAIDGSQAEVSDVVKAFCVSMLGPLLKPYPMDMKVHCEIILNQLLDMLDHKHSPRVQEAIYSSLITMSKHNQTRVIQALLSWHPEKISTDAENIIKCYVKEKPVRVWKVILSKISLVR